MNNDTHEDNLSPKEEMALVANLLHGGFYKRWKVARAFFLILTLISISLYALADLIAALVLGVIFCILCLYLQVQINIANKAAREVLEKKHSSSKDDDEICFENEYKLNLVNALEIEFRGKTYALSVKHKSRDWEDDDICLANDGNRDFTFHPRTFLTYMENHKSEFLQRQSSNFIESVKLANWIKLHYMDDSRFYHEINIDGEVKSIPAHYMSIDSYLGIVDGGVYVISSNFVDGDQKELPKIITKIDEDLWSRDSARYSKEDEIWVYEENA
jgi:hypothetical protein